eukprot:scpid81318/ scgid17093/ Beta-glucanase; 1,3-1,4-beta-D-glucan 4-glucanohydrolase; Endo-beta-1,3-1,4 glucanase; Lichenase
MKTRAFMALLLAGIAFFHSAPVGARNILRGEIRRPGFGYGEGNHFEKERGERVHSGRHEHAGMNGIAHEQGPASGFNISFTDRTKSLEIFEEGNEHLTTGGSSSCARPDHLAYNFTLPDCNGCRGLRITLDNKNATCASSAGISTGHLASTVYYSYGDFEIYARTGHSPSGGDPPQNVFTCFSAYTFGRSRDGVHNEIALCWPGDDPGTIHMGHWNGKNGDHEHRTDLKLGFDASAGYHRYKFQWRRDSITYFIDGTEVHRSDGDTMPFENLSMRIILRPDNKPSTYEGDAFMTVRFASYVPEPPSNAERQSRQLYDWERS